jgi:hypothetical protein
MVRQFCESAEMEFGLLPRRCRQAQWNCLWGMQRRVHVGMEQPVLSYSDTQQLEVQFEMHQKVLVRSILSAHFRCG